MDDADKIDALGSWILRETGSAAFTEAPAVRAYEALSTALYTRIREGLSQSTEEVVHWIHRVGRAVQSDMDRGAEAQQGRAMLAFLENAEAFLHFFGGDRNGSDAGGVRLAAVEHYRA